METLETLMKAAQHEDKEAFSTLVERFQDMACASAYAMLGDRQLAEDATQEALNKTASTPTRLLETGIKTIDLMAPLASGGVVGLIAGYGVGKEVVTEEIMQHLFTRRQAIGVIAGMRETTYAASSLYEMVRESELDA